MLRATWMILVMVVLLASTGCDRGSSMLPRKVAGEWTTNDERYSGRVLELSPVFVILINSATEAPSVQWIDRVTVEAAGTDEKFTVYSTDHSLGTHEQMSFEFSPANGGEIRFRNGQVWKRPDHREK